MRALVTRVAGLIRIDAIWLAVEPLDMRCGPQTALARVVKVFGVARAHHAYVFANRRANRIKVLINDGFGLWLCARQLHRGRFLWPAGDGAMTISLTVDQVQALTLGLPWQQLARDAAICVV